MLPKKQSRLSFGMSDHHNARVRLNNIIKVASEPIAAVRILKAAPSAGGPAANRNFSLPKRTGHTLVAFRRFKAD